MELHNWTQILVCSLTENTGGSKEEGAHTGNGMWFKRKSIQSRHAWLDNGMVWNIKTNCAYNVILHLLWEVNFCKLLAVCSIFVDGYWNRQHAEIMWGMSFHLFHNFLMVLTMICPSDCSVVLPLGDSELEWNIWVTYKSYAAHSHLSVYNYVPILLTFFLLPNWSMEWFMVTAYWNWSSNTITKTNLVQIPPPPSLLLLFLLILLFLLLLLLWKDEACNHSLDFRFYYPADRLGWPLELFQAYLPLANLTASGLFAWQ